MPIYELIDHTADIGLRIYGTTPKELFEHAATALFDVLTDPAHVELRETRVLRLSRDSQEELLVEWLGSLLYLFDTQHFLCSRFAIDALTGTRLSATVAGEVFSPERHEIKTELKAVTYHNLSIVQEGGVFKATVILDV
jgi:SHS2 domain-containing protein